MNRKTSRTGLRAPVAIALTAGLAFGLAGSASAAEPTVLTVFSDWTAGDQQGFESILNQFNKDTGIKYELSGTTDFLPVLQTRIAAGNAPMITIVPRPGVIADFAGQNLLTSLKDLAVDVDSNYSPSITALGSVGDVPYGLMVKANSKSVVYYDPKSTPDHKPLAPADWTAFKAVLDQYVAQGKKPLAVSAKDGWTLTDWFENVYLRQAGPDKYKDLFAGKTNFTDPSVKAAVDEMMSVIHNDKYVSGGTTVASSVGYNDSLAKVFGAKPDGYLVMEGGFTTGVVTVSTNPGLKPGTDIQFFHFPNIETANSDAVELGGDFAVSFANNDLTKKFMQWLARPETAKLWAQVGVIDPNKNADASALPNVLMQQESQQLTTAKIAAFDGSDQMPGGIGDDWGSTLQGIYQDPSKADDLLKTFAENAKSNDFGP